MVWLIIVINNYGILDVFFTSFASIQKKKRALAPSAAYVMYIYNKLKLSDGVSSKFIIFTLLLVLLILGFLNKYFTNFNLQRTSI